MSLDHKGYQVYPAAQQLKNEDGSPGKWYGNAAILKWKGDEGPLVLPMSWIQPLFATEQEAKLYAFSAAKDMIDSGRCKI